ncbi:NAC domain-containing protein 18-like [Panicum miliaceum]|uniref:NAC domain-containing protein 18-like n=1 Tax=Panicum miliaceum TaxID=4540 RepID=A0A3L6PM46_PANMI|nr:NAC domain-containing protein 18-like [Panicum miliaceum]
MEASRFGFDPSLPPACKFDPTDADIVAHYLLPRAAGVPDPPYAHAVIEDDTCSCPPWELLRRHGHGGSDHAFFVGPPGDPTANGGRACRRVRGGSGLWRGQKGEESDLVVARGSRGGAELRLRYRRYNLAYYRAGDPSTSGWVMHEYHILRPKLLPGAVLSRIRITDKGKEERKKQQEAAAAKKVAPGPAHQPGRSNYLVDDHAAAVASDAEGTSSGAQSGVIPQGDDGNGGGGGGVGETTGGYRTNFLSVGEGDGYYAGDSNSYFNFNPDQRGPSYLVYGHAAGNAVALNDGGAGTSGAQSDAVHQGGDVYGGGVAGETTGGYDTNFFNTAESATHATSTTATTTSKRA